MLLIAAWSGILSMPLGGHFTGHMVTHLAVVALAAPLLALALVGSRFDPTPASPLLFSPVTASALELLIIWGWHLPAAHQWAQASMAAFIAEQGSFLVAGLLLWLSAFAGGGRERAAFGVVALLFTSMHMTLLGVLLALAPRPLYSVLPGDAVVDQQVGGLLMLAIGSGVYLAGGLALLPRVLRCHAAGTASSANPVAPSGQE